MSIRLHFASGYLILTLLGCERPVEEYRPDASATARSPDTTMGSSAPSASAAASLGAVPIGVPISPADVAKVINPNAEAPYAGPTGTLKGKVHYKGDPPPNAGLAFPAKCASAAATYGKKFRLGQDDTIADVLVAVTEYSGFVPEKSEAAKTTVHGCAFARRTIAMTFGQRLEVSNLDPVESYMPFLKGAVSKAVMVAVPKGDAVRLYPQQPGKYELLDQLPKPFLKADVYVLAYATHAVTDLDGEFEIGGIPVGKVKVNAFLPSIDVTTEKAVEIKEGVNALELTLEWHEKRAGTTDAGAR